MELIFSSCILNLVCQAEALSIFPSFIRPCLANVVDASCLSMTNATNIETSSGTGLPKGDCISMEISRSVT